ncbi:hypothetical protein KKE03_03440 [Patescibacteria group bacterium]|nr:hypothetical protein [Patescibacteria group bacterium]
MREKGHALSESKGISLIESLLIIVVIGLMVYLLAGIPNALGLITKSRHLSLAREIAVKQIEDKRAINYSNLVNDTTSISDSRLSLLSQGTGEVTVEDCDPAICTSGEYAKQVTVVVSWLDNNKAQNVTLKTMIGEGGVNQ